ncbi:hypothetical protein Bbelb_139440 [Branchiostoma belcheri]|nr:hypothetical protein Bbelb_139440 [Branchiostoma belcheri]
MSAESRNDEKGRERNEERKQGYKDRNERKAGKSEDSVLGDIVPIFPHGCPLSGASPQLGIDWGGRALSADGRHRYYAIMIPRKTHPARDQRGNYPQLSNITSLSIVLIAWLEREDIGRDLGRLRANGSPRDSMSEESGAESRPLFL